MDKLKLNISHPDFKRDIGRVFSSFVSYGQHLKYEVALPSDTRRHIPVDDGLPRRLMCRLRAEFECAGSRVRAFQLRVQRECIGVGSCGVELQSGVEHALRRERRERIQREAAEKKAKQAKQSVPKQERYAERKKSRDLKEQINCGTQSLRDIAVSAALVTIGALGFKLARGGIRVTDNLLALFDGIRSVGTQLKRFLKHLWFVPLVVVLKYFTTQWKSAFLTASLAAFLPHFLGVDVWAHISEFFPSGGVELQSGFDSIARLLSVAFTFSVFRGKVSPAKVSEFCKRLGNLDRMSKGWESFITWTMSALETLVNFVRSKFGKESVELYARSDRIAIDWAKKAEDFLRKDAIGEEVDPAILDDVLVLLQQGYGLKELYRNTDVGKLIDVLVARLGSAVAPHLGSVSARNNFRFEPVATFLYGLPGVGKTVMAVPFVTALLLKSGLVETPCTSDQVTREMWQKGTSEYWQGYDRQKAIILDDAFQNRSFTGDKDNDYFNMIKMCGSFSMPLNFADLASKGKIFFASKLIFGSTNLCSIDAEAKIVIQEPAAVARRINYGYELFVNEEYKLNGKLDYRRFRAEWDRCVSELQPGDDPLRAFPWYIWFVREHDFLRGTTSAVDISLASAINTIADDIRGRMAAHEVTKRNLDAMIGAFGVEVQGLRLFERFDSMKKLVARNRAEFLDDVSCVNKLLKITVFAAGTYMAFKVIEAILSGFCKLLGGFFGVKNHVVVNSNRPVTRLQAKRSPVIMQAGEDRGVTGSVYANTYKVFSKDGLFVLGQVLFVAGEVALQPQHYTEVLRERLESKQLRESDVLVFRNAVNPEHNVEFTIGQYLGFKRFANRAQDYEFVCFQSIRAHRKIVHAFVTERDLKYVGGNSGLLHVCEVDDRTTIRKENRYAVWKLPSLGIGRDLRFGNRQMGRYVKYPAYTTPGDCGAPLTLEDARVFGGRCLLGVHVAGQSTRAVAYANIVTREIVDEVLSHFKVVTDNFVEDLSDRGIVLQAGNVLPFEVKGSFLPIGVVDKPITICPVSKLRKTELYGSLGDYDYFPAPLNKVVRDGVEVWPMERALLPYSSPVVHFGADWLEDAVHVAFKPFVERTVDVSRELYSFEDAVLGVPQDKFRSIPRGTAAGFPYVYDVTGGKREFFGEADVYDLTLPRAVELKQRVEYVLSSARQGVRLSHVFVDFLKDELRSAKKVEAVATRLISSAPLDYVVAWRMLFGSFTSAMMRINVSTGMAPGICTYTDWPRVAEHLQQHGGAVFDGDFKSFDSSEQPCLHDLILNAINRWYGDSSENQLARRVLWLELVHSRHIGGVGNDQKHIYQWNKSLPSGHPFTTVVNSLYSLVTLVGAYMHLTGDRVGFWANVAPLTYGDDNVSNVSLDVVDVFNRVTVSGAMQECFSLVYTAGDKEAELSPYGELSQATFLKRGFRLEANNWFCPLELDSFLFTHYWVKNQKLKRAIMEDVLENALQELSLHDQSAWETHSPKLMALLKEHFGVDTRVAPTRKSYQALILSRKDDWY